MAGEAVALLRLHLSSHPFVAFLATTLLLSGAGRLFGRARRDTDLPLATAYALAAAAGVVGIVAYAAVAVFYAVIPQYFDAAEPTMTALGWLFHAGHPVYHTVDAAERYSHIYGPMAFIAHGVAFDLFGPGILVSKGVGVGLAIASLGLTCAALRGVTTPRRAVLLTGITALLLLEFRNYSFWTRAEPLQAFCVSVTLLAAARGRGLPSSVVMGLAIGALCNAKITGPLYVIPLLVLAYARHGWRHVTCATIVAAATAYAPFAVFPSVSLDNYLTWLRLSAQTGLLVSTLRQNIEWLAFFATPLMLAYFAAPGGNRDRGWARAGVTAAIAAAACGIAVAGAKPGAGPYHFLPLLPVVAYLAAWQVGRDPLAAGAGRHMPAALHAFLLVALLTAGVQQAQFLSTMAARASDDEAGDIRDFADSHHGVIEMGYGAYGVHVYLRPILVFRNDAYFIDQPAVAEHQLAGVPLPSATIAAVRQCRVDYWLLPRGEAPFSATSVYAAVLGQPLFPEAFRAAFTESYARVGVTRYFDVWGCRAHGAPADRAGTTS